MKKLPTYHIRVDTKAIRAGCQEVSLLQLIEKIEEVDICQPVLTHIILLDSVGFIGIIFLVFSRNY